MSEGKENTDVRSNGLQGLTMHGVPDYQASIDANETIHRTRMGRWKMALLFAVCIAPVVASYFAYYIWRPEGLRNYGELIQPMRALPAVSGQRLDGEERTLSSLRGQWLLASVAGGSCNPACEKHLYLQRQIREALGKEKDRVDWVWFIDDEKTVRAELQSALSNALVLRVSPEHLKQWLKPTTAKPLTDHIYLIDPQGHYMMRFPAQAEPTKIKRDLERLLRAASSWDRPGRNGEKNSL